MIKRITVCVRASARHNAVLETAPGEYQVSTSAAAERGKANEAVIALLAKHFSVSKSRVRIVFGKTAREKMVEVLINS